MLSDPMCFDDHTYGVHISVKNPILHITWDEGQYTSYAIFLETCNVAFKYPKTLVRRRYSEFVKLRKLLKAQHPTLDPPSLPSKSLFSDKFCSKFINERKRGLETFLLKVIQNPLYLSNRTLHLFIQSNLPMDEIESVVCGQQRKHIKSEPHLILCPCPAFMSGTDSPDSTNNKEQPNFCNLSLSENESSVESGSPDSHSHVTMGSRISICTPTLEVPPEMDAGSPDDSESEIAHIGSLDSNCSSTAGTSCPNYDKSPVSHGILHFRTSSQNSNMSESPARKKRVSFHSEVTVAHLFTE